MDVEATNTAEAPRSVNSAPDDAPVNRQLIFQKPDEELVATLRKWYLEDADARKASRKRQQADWKMYSGDQWEPEAKMAAQRQKRPLLTLNYVLPTIAAIEGEERSNRQEIKVYGRNDASDKGAEGFNLMIRWVMNECNGEYALSGAFRHSAVCGEGWLHPDVDFFDDPEGSIVLRHVDEDEITLDASSVAPDASDARRLTRARWLKDDEIEGMFPGALDKLVHSSMALGGNYIKETDGSGFRDIYTAPSITDTKVFDAKKREWLVLEHWWFEIGPGYAAVDPATDGIVELSLEEGDALQAQHAKATKAHMIGMMMGTVPTGTPFPAAPQMAKRPVRQFFQAFTCSDVLLDKGPHPVPEARRFPYVPVYAYHDKLKKEFFGMVRSIADVQRQHNVEQSAIVHMMQVLPKAGWKAPRGAYHDKQKWENSASLPGVTLEYNEKRGEPKPIEQQTIPRHMIEMAQSRMVTMRDISGVNTEMTGQRVASDAGVVMEMRKKAALTVLASIFDNFRLSKKVLGKLLIVYIQKYVAPGRRFRIMGSGGDAQYVTFTEDMAFARYGAIIDETSSTVNDRMQALTLLQTVLPTIIDAGLPVPPGLIDLLPLPPLVRDEWKAMIAQLQASNGMAPPGAAPAPVAPPAPTPPPAAPPQA